MKINIYIVTGSYIQFNQFVFKNFLSKIIILSYQVNQCLTNVQNAVLFTVTETLLF